MAPAFYTAIIPGDGDDEDDVDDDADAAVEVTKKVFRAANPMLGAPVNLNRV